MKYNVLIIGSGGREHAFAWKLAQSPLTNAILVAPGNAGTAQIAQNIDLDAADFSGIDQAIDTHAIDLVLVGPEVPLVGGLVDHLAESRPAVQVVGPHKSGAQLEGSKAFAKAFMQRHDIPTASYREFSSEQLQEGLRHLESQTLPIVLKADGLAAGKGVVICESLAEARETLKEMLNGKFGEASSHVVIEEFLSGIEFSVFVATDGHSYKILPIAKDYKRIGEGDTGLNTGGMGSISPVPFVDEVLMKKVIARIVEPSINGIKLEDLQYQGFLFIGLIEVGGDPYVIEYNCRMGDPETQSVLPRLDSDFMELCLAISTGTLDTYELHISNQRQASVILVSGGYPQAYEKGKLISGLDAVRNSTIFHAGTTEADSHIVTAGGRVLAVTSSGESISAALKASYEDAAKIHFEGMNFRRDLGFDLDVSF